MRVYRDFDFSFLLSDISHLKRHFQFNNSISQHSTPDKKSNFNPLMITPTSTSKLEHQGRDDANTSNDNKKTVKDDSLKLPLHAELLSKSATEVPYNVKISKCNISSSSHFVLSSEAGNAVAKSKRGLVKGVEYSNTHEEGCSSPLKKRCKTMTTCTEVEEDEMHATSVTDATNPSSVQHLQSSLNPVPVSSSTQVHSNMLFKKVHPRLTALTKLTNHMSPVGRHLNNHFSSTNSDMANSADIATSSPIFNNKLVSTIESSSPIVTGNEPMCSSLASQKCTDSGFVASATDKTNFLQDMSTIDKRDMPQQLDSASENVQSIIRDGNVCHERNSFHFSNIDSDFNEELSSNLKEDIRSTPIKSFSDCQDNFNSPTKQNVNRKRILSPVNSPINYYVNASIDENLKHSALNDMNKENYFKTHSSSEMHIFTKPQIPAGYPASFETGLTGQFDIVSVSAGNERSSPDYKRVEENSSFKEVNNSTNERDVANVVQQSNADDNLVCEMDDRQNQRILDESINTGDSLMDLDTPLEALRAAGVEICTESSKMCHPASKWYSKLHPQKTPTKLR